MLRLQSTTLQSACVLDQGGKLTEEIVANKALLKACLACTADAQIGALTALELLIVKVLACRNRTEDSLSEQRATPDHCASERAACSREPPFLLFSFGGALF